MKGWKGVKDPVDRRRVVYWLYTDGNDRCLGAVSRRVGGWRALGYTLNPAERIPTGNVELGVWPTRRKAEKAVLMYELLGRRAPECPSCGSLCNWADDAWICTGCADEWHPEHGPEFAAS
jgi:hypothetical protein